MGITEKIDQVIQKRNEKTPLLESKRAKLLEISDTIKKINLTKQEMTSNSAINENIRNAILSIDTSSLSLKMNDLINFYNETIERFSKQEINIAVVGAARQGKSLLIQSITNLDDKVIPAFSSGDCTGTTSVIKNIPGLGVKAEITFRDESEMVDVVQRYLDQIYGNGTVKVGSFGNIGRLSIAELKAKLSAGDVSSVKFQHLCKYIEHFNEWSKLVHEGGSGKITITDPEEIQMYVAQHNGKKESAADRKNYYYYLAVKEAVISCEFHNPNTGKIVLRDTIGLGDTAIGISDKMLDTIRLHSDAAIIVRRPETATGKLDQTDVDLYTTLNSSFSSRNMNKWLFWLINKTGNDSPYNSNGDRCEAFKNQLNDLNWNVAASEIVDVANQEAVDKFLLETVLSMLVNNIDDIDAGIMTQIDQYAEDAYAEFKRLQDMIKGVLVQGASETFDADDFIDNNWDSIYNSGLMKRFKEYKGKLFEKRVQECAEFKKKVAEILSNSRNLIPDKQTLLTELKKGGVNPIDVYNKQMNKFRTEFTREFLNMDELVFDKLVSDFKNTVIKIFVAEDGGKFNRLMSSDDFETPEEWLDSFSEKYFSKVQYEQFGIAFNSLSDFILTVRGFLMHQIRESIDNRLDPTLNGDFTIDNSYSDEMKAESLYLYMLRQYKIVKEELETRFSSSIYSDPNRIFSSMMCEFYDRLNFSFQKNNVNIETAWKRFYKEHIFDIWNDELQSSLKMNDLYREWSELSNALSAVNRRDFSANV